jgi:hypothetical protein
MMTTTLAVKAGDEEESQQHFRAMPKAEALALTAAFLGRRKQRLLPFSLF